jgi:hypothetical protein
MGAFDRKRNDEGLEMLNKKEVPTMYMKIKETMTKCRAKNTLSFGISSDMSDKLQNLPGFVAEYAETLP